MTGIKNIRELARLLNVSPSTVSRVLNNPGGCKHVSEAMRLRVTEEMRKLDYIPNINAKRLFTKKSNIIALVLPDIAACRSLGDRHALRMLYGLEVALRNSGYRLLLPFSDAQFVERKEYLSLFREKSIDGMIVWGAGAGETHWDELAAAGYPVVFSTSPSGMARDFSSVLHDYGSASGMLLDYLAGRGHRNIGWIGGIEGNGTTVQMEEGLDAALRRHRGLKVFRKNGDFMAGNAVALCRALLAEHGGITAILAGNIFVARAIQKDMALRPGDYPPLELASCDNSDQDAEDYAGGMACAFVDDYELGMRSVKLLIELIGGRPGPVKELIPVELLGC